MLLHRFPSVFPINVTLIAHTYRLLKPLEIIERKSISNHVNSYGS